MKKAFSWSVLAVALACIVFLLGIFVGRNGLSQDTNTTLDRTIVYITKPSDTKININTADISALRSLPGIGEVLAQRIIDYRTEHGAFESVLQLTSIDGIGDTTVENIIELICLED